MVRTKEPPTKRQYRYVVHNTDAIAPQTTIRQMLALQKSTKTQIPKLPFGRLIRGILNQYGLFKLQFIALEALQEAAEMYLTELFSDSQKLCSHAKRATLRPTDMRLVLDIRGNRDVGYRHLAR